MPKLDLACGPQNKVGYVHHENVGAKEYLPHVDIEHDLTVFPWPWADGEFQEIRAEDIVEHLPNLIDFMNECHRIMAPGGVLIIRTPAWDAEFSHIDPTHIRLYALDTFDFFDPMTAYGSYNTHLTDKKWAIATKNRTENNNLEVTLTKR